MKTPTNQLLICIIIFMLQSIFCSRKTVTEAENLTVFPYEWALAQPEDQGLDSEKLDTAIDAAEKLSFIHSLLIIRNGFLVSESYFNGYDKNILFLTYSVTKSITSALIGIALQDGYIESLDQRMLDFFPEYGLQLSLFFGCELSKEF